MFNQDGNQTDPNPNTTSKDTNPTDQNTENHSESTQADQHTENPQPNFDIPEQAEQIDSEPSNSEQTTENSTNHNPLQHLQKELEDSKAKLQELTQISQHALADLQNYKKRSEEEKQQIFTFANANLITEILPVLDNIERASQYIPTEAQEWATGIIAVMKQLEDILSTQGLSKIQTVNQPFNPTFHEAVLTENGPKDQIIKELQSGFSFRDKVIRPAKVTVGNGENSED